MSNRDRLLAAHQRKINECRELKRENAALRDRLVQLQREAAPVAAFDVDGNGRIHETPAPSLWRRLFGGS